MSSFSFFVSTNYLSVYEVRFLAADFLEMMHDDVAMLFGCHHVALFVFLEVHLIGRKRSGCCEFSECAPKF